MLAEIEKDAVEGPAAPSDSTTKRIATLAAEQLRYERLIAQAEQELEELAAAHKNIAERLLPDAMAEAGVSAFELTDGSKISVKPFYGATITDANRNECHKWLEHEGHGSLIKKTVAVDIEKADAETFAMVTLDLDHRGVSYKVKEGVHAATLNAFVKEQVQGGQPFPMDLFKVFTGRKAKIVQGGK